jgi:AcrR family transcriptional regulator
MTTDNHRLLSGTHTAQSARARIIAAFNAMVLKRQRGPFRVGMIIRHAGVARSTFYDHFASEAALQLTAIEAPFASIADALTGRGEREQLIGWLAHFWDYRQQARPLLTGAERTRIERAFVALLLERLSAGVAGDASPSTHLAAIQIAAATLASLEQWLSGRLSYSPEALADQLVIAADAIRRTVPVI